MSSETREPRGYLPRLAPEYYRGVAVVLWTHTLENRAVGWLNDRFHHEFRESALHTALREDLLCPAYVLMPDHIHVIWMGVSTDSDQRLATTFLRTQLKHTLGDFCLQHQSHDRILRKEDRKRHAFSAACSYVLENPVRAGLVMQPADWLYTGSIVPGYPNLHPCAPDFWDKFWPLYNGAVNRSRVGKIPSAS